MTKEKAKQTVSSSRPLARPRYVDREPQRWLPGPLLPLAVRDRLPGQVLSGPFGEVMATGILPRAAQG